MIALVFALKYESAAIREPNRLCASIWNLGLTGKRCVNGLEERLRRVRPNLIVSIGFAGGLQPGFPVGSLIIGENLTCPHVLQTLHKLHGFTFGKVVTSAHIVATSLEKKNLGISSGALTVDCESHFIREACDRRDIPMLAVRCVSDTVEQDLPLPGSILINDKTGKPDPGALFKYVLSHPSKISGLRELVSNSRIAQKSLAAGVSAILPRLLTMKSASRFQSAA